MADIEGCIGQKAMVNGAGRRYSAVGILRDGVIRVEYLSPRGTQQKSLYALCRNNLDISTY